MKTRMLKFPYKRHGLAGRPSNHSKLDVMADFLEFVDLNTQPNGRHTGSYNAQFFFIPKFSRIAPFNIIINTLLAEEQVGRPARP